MRKIKAPGYIFLMAEYIETLEAFLRLPSAPEIKEQAKKRLDQLKAVNIEDICVEQLCRELEEAKKQLNHSQNLNH